MFVKKGEWIVSEEEKKKNGEYEQPQSKGMDEELDDVSGGSGTTEERCSVGPHANYDCYMGGMARGCHNGSRAHENCRSGEYGVAV